MAKVTTIQTQFVGGELSPRLDGRPDVKKFQQGCRVLQNAVVAPHGGARKRGGSKFVVEQQSTTDDVVLVPFQYNVEQSYCLIFGPSYVWFAKDQGIITHTAINITGVTAANPGVVTATAHGFSNGDRVVIQSVGGMTELNNRQFIAANVTANTFELTGINTSSYTAYTSGGTVAEIVYISTTYTADQIDELQFAQLNDTLYITHKDHPLRKLTRSGHTAWTLSTPVLTTGPFRTINGDSSLILTPSSFSAAATSYGTHIVGETFTLTASSAVFTSTMVGALFRLTEDGGSSGIPSAALGDSTKTLQNGDVYTNNGLIYGIANVSGATTWEKFNRVPTHDQGTVRVIGSQAGGTITFDSLFLHPGYCNVRITAFTSSTVVTCQIVRYQMPKSIVTGGTSFWEEGAWSDYRGYARAVAFYEQRLCLAGSVSDPTVIWSSRSGAYEDFEDGGDDDDAIIYRVAAGTGDVFRWLSSGRVLTAGSSLGEFAVAASNQNEALTPTNFKAVPQTSYGSSAAPPVRVNQTVLYPQREGVLSNPAKKLREYTYDFAQDAFNSADLTIFSEHITGAGFDRIGYQLAPESLVWIRRTDGVLACCTYERAQEIVAWARQVLGGTSAEARAMCVVPGADGDELWLSVKRTINGGTVRYIEILTHPFADDGDKEDCTNLDCFAAYDGASTTTISGLWHLRGEAVKVLNNGAVETGTVTAVGRLTLTRATTKACIGYRYTMVLETEDFEAGAQAGTAQSRAKRISQVFVRMLSSLGGTIGPDADGQQAILYRTPADVMGSSPALRSGLIENDFNGGWNRFARVRIEHDDPFPFHVAGVVAEMNTTG